MRAASRLQRFPGLLGVRVIASAINWGDRRLSPLFWQSVFVEPNTNCWLREGDTQYISRYRRLAYRTLVGPIEDGDRLQPTCGSNCINPCHASTRTPRTPEQDALARKRRKERLPDWKKQRQWLRWRYGLSLADFETMLASQNGCCVICGVAFGSIFKDKPRVDHCHSTGRIRDLLCTGCNTGLGSFRDRPSLLRAAADYLEKHGTKEGE